MGRDTVSESPSAKQQNSTTLQLTPETRNGILRQFELISLSPEFRQSEQSKRLLRYLIEQTLDGNLDALRERAIGAALFGLELGYDTNENPIVRVRANEIRKRLGKYYLHAAPEELRLQIPAGAYRVEFKNAPAAAPDLETPPQAAEVIAPAEPRWRRKVAYAAAAAILLAVAVATTWYLRPVDPLLDFWRPALNSPSPVIICSGHPVVYGFTREYRTRVTGAVSDHYKTLTDALKLGPEQVLHGNDIVAIPNQYIGIGSAEAVAKIDAWLARQHKDADIRFGNDLSFGDLRKAPAVVIGAFQNRWTVEFTHGLRFVFQTVDGQPSVRDVQSGKLWSLPHLKDNGSTDEDYIVLSRVLHASSGEFVVAGAGITQYGSRTVAELLTHPTLLAESLKKAKPGWQSRNLQLLYHVQVIGESAGPPELIAMHEW